MLLDHQVAAAADVDARFVAEIRPRQSQRDCTLGEIAEHVERGERRGHRLQYRQRIGERVEQSLVEFAFARHRAIACAEHLVFERLQFARDVAFGVLDRLSPHPVGRHAVGLAATHFDEVALHAVVAEAQVLEAGAFAFTGLEVEQRLVAVLADAAQFVEGSVEAGGKNSAFPQQCGRSLDQRMGQMLVDGRMRTDACGKSLQQRGVQGRELRLQFGQATQGLAQLRQVAGPCGAQRHAREDTFDVTHLAQQGMQ